MSIEQNKAVIRRFYEEIGNQRQFAVADEIIGADFKMFPESQPPYGSDGVKQFMTWLIIDTFPDLRVTIDDMIAERDIVAVRVGLHATHTATVDWIQGFAPIPPTGKPFVLLEYHFWRVVEGKIVERWPMFDTLGMLDQLGAIGSK